MANYLIRRKNVIELESWEYNVVEQLLSMGMALELIHSMKEKRYKNGYNGSNNHSVSISQGH